MSTKVKGIFKGFKNIYNISTIFDEKNEDEIQIGFPTDVKHVAHIGLDGPSATTPAWMENMKSASDAPEPEPEPSRPPATENSSETHQENSTKVEGVQNNVRKSKPSKESRSADGAKLTRSRRPLVDSSSDSSTRESSRHTRRSRHSDPSSESLSEETAAPKQHRRRKSKASNGEGSVRSSRRSSKENSMTDISLSVVESGPQVEGQSETRF